MIRKRIKRKYYFLINILLILFFACFLFKMYSEYSMVKINLVSEEFFQKEIYNSLNSTVFETMKQNDIEDILEIYKNKDGEILYVDYNLNGTYNLLGKITSNIKHKLNENYNLEKGITYEVPFLIGSDNVFLSNIGPKITIKVNYINSILTNVYTKISNYGMNNALVEAYVQITIEGRIVTPISSNQKKVSYDVLISSKIINGRIPMYYGNYLGSNSSIFDVPIN